MPIKPENKARYPSAWKKISRRVRDEAGNVCEWCKAPNGQIICRGDGSYMLEDGETYCDTTGQFLGVLRGSEYDGVRMVKVILTVAHLDHQPENCARDNLVALRQKCHLTYEAKLHAANANATRRAKLAVGDLFA